ncbi:MAG: HEAT repeat domain-containing protein, partial [Anaerolineae bacterium]
IAVSRHDSERAFTLLKGIVTDRSLDSEVRARALFALGRGEQGQKLGAVLEDVIRNERDPEVLEAALFALSNVEGDLPGRIFLDLIKDPSCDEDVRVQALFLAGRENLLTAPVLQEIYDSSDNLQMKEQVCHVASLLDDEQAALDVLLHIARTEQDPSLRRAAIFWIGECDDPRAADFLIEVINEE